MERAQLLKTERVPKIIGDLFCVAHLFLIYILLLLSSTKIHFSMHQRREAFSIE